jgi:Subtilase family
VRAARRTRLCMTLFVTLMAAGGIAASVPAVSAASLPARTGAGAAAAGPAAPATPGSAAPDERRVCPAATRPGEMECQSVFHLAGRGGPGAPAFVSAAAPVPGLTPAQLRRAYGLTNASARHGRGETIAIVDAYRDPAAAGDLARYRTRFGLGSCTTSSGCLRIVDQHGRPGPLPAASAAWAVEESLDLDMVSAICPHCRILLVESNTSRTVSLGQAENAAVAAGARFVSNSWSGAVARGQAADNHYFNHPGDALVFAAGDDGYGTAYPANLQYVTAVGGTTLRRAPARPRGWTETVWGSTAPAVTGGTGSGCSRRTAKPSWQREPVDIAAAGCAGRTENDVAAVANPSTGVSVYDTYQTGGTWTQLGGTSAATPIITAVYALAGRPAPRSYPASYLYQHPAQFHDVASGVDGVCPAGSYLCHGEPGYDGPTGLGTPDGIYGFSRAGTDPVTLVDPGAGTVRAGARFTLRITGLDSRSATAALRYRATGLPAGLSVRRVARSTSARITGTLRAAIAANTVFHVVVTARDPRTGRSGATRFTLTIG